MKTKTILRPVCLLAALVLASGAAQAEKIVEVNCNDGDKISSALDKFEGKKFKAITIVIKGTCNESPTVILDDLTLKSDPSSPNATVKGPITIDGAQRAVVEDLDITGSNTDGISVINGASATINDNSITDYDEAGLSIDNGSTVVATGNDITGGVSGIYVARNSSAWLQGGNDVSGASEETVFVHQSSSFRAGVGDTEDNFANSGVCCSVFEVKEVSSLDIRNAEVTCSAPCSNGAIGVVGGATLRTRDVEITGDVSVGAGSGARLDDTTFVSGSLNCSAGSYGFGGDSGC
jgi:hypothetical protein